MADVFWGRRFGRCASFAIPRPPVNGAAVVASLRNKNGANRAAGLLGHRGAVPHYLQHVHLRRLLRQPDRKWDGGIQGGPSTGASETISPVRWYVLTIARCDQERLD